jgi:hypothetical protein
MSVAACGTDDQPKSAPDFADAHPGSACSKMIRHAGRRMATKAFVGGASQGLEIGIIWHAKHGSRSGPDFMPVQAIEPAILVGTITHRQHDCSRQPARLVAFRREFQGFNQFHIGLDLRLLAIGAPTECCDDIPRMVRPGFGPDEIVWSTPAARCSPVMTPLNRPPSSHQSQLPTGFSHRPYRLVVVSGAAKTVNRRTKASKSGSISANVPSKVSSLQAARY